MTLTAIFRASDRAEFGAQVHLLLDTGQPLLAPQGDTVITTLCGKVGIGPVVDRPGATCALCLAVSGQHPGGRGKRFLTRWHRATHPHVPRIPEEAGHGR